MSLTSSSSNHFLSYKQIRDAIRSASEERPANITAFLPASYDNPSDAAKAIAHIIRTNNFELEIIDGEVYAWSKPKEKKERPKGLRISGNMNPRDYMESKSKMNDEKLLEEAYLSIYK